MSKPKSLSMVFFAHLLQQELNSPTIVVLTDRNDLDDQLYGQFSKCKDFLRQIPQQASSRENLKELLADREANGIIFTTMQKFEGAESALSERRNIVVMADEAHRGQYGFEKINEDGKDYITIYYGEDVKEKQAQKVADLFTQICPDADVNLLSGGQPVYYYMISAE